MKAVQVKAPEGHQYPGSIHTIPEADLEGFQANGWELVEEAKDEPKQEAKQDNKKKNTKPA